MNQWCKNQFGNFYSRLRPFFFAFSIRLCVMIPFNRKCIEIWMYTFNWNMNSAYCIDCPIFGIYLHEFSTRNARYFTIYLIGSLWKLIHLLKCKHFRNKYDLYLFDYCGKCNFNCHIDENWHIFTLTWTELTTAMFKQLLWKLYRLEIRNVENSWCLFKICNYYFLLMNDAWKSGKHKYVEKFSLKDVIHARCTRLAALRTLSLII